MNPGGGEGLEKGGGAGQVQEGLVGVGARMLRADIQGVESF